MVRTFAASLAARGAATSTFAATPTFAAERRVFYRVPLVKQTCNSFSNLIAAPHDSLFSPRTTF